MKTANYQDKRSIVDILSKSFEANQSINYIIKQDKKRARRIRSLMDYSFEVCWLFGNVFLSDDKKACALILYPDKKKTSLKSVFLDAKLIFRCIGLMNIRKILARETLIKKIQPKGKLMYLWFIGTEPSQQNKGIGSNLARSVIQLAQQNDRSIYLETSTIKNLPWYKKLGFEIYNEQDLGYRLYFLQNSIKK